MSTINLEALEASFDPPLWRKPRRGQRDATLIYKRGMVLGGIVVYYHAGASGPIEVPEALTILNRPEHREPVLPLSDLDREALRGFIRDRLRSRADPPGYTERADARVQIGLLKKARAARSGRRN